MDKFIISTCKWSFNKFTQRIFYQLLQPQWPVFHRSTYTWVAQVSPDDSPCVHCFLPQSLTCLITLHFQLGTQDVGRSTRQRVF